jgi:hypothetical protein
VADVLFDAFLLALCFYVTRTWVRWFRTEVRLVAPKWRSGTTTFGFALSTLSLACIISLMIYATISSSFTPINPTAQLAYQIIFLTSVTAIVAGIVGTGPLETPTFVCSVVCLAILVIAGIAS